MANTTWSTTDKTANVSLSGGNLVATSTSSANGGARATDRYVKSGKLYWEFTINTANAVGVGVGSGTADFTNFVTTTTQTAFINQAGVVRVAGVSGIGFPTLVN